ncbi:MAG: ornithine cyclodeaminase, partial [Rhodobacteraceae bacterium]|nr:ornithine cyclodeaminase [Paracoccaceae bacterium]
RTSDDQITIAKNGGGAHLDLMTAAYILGRWRQR